MGEAVIAGLAAVLVAIIEAAAAWDRRQVRRERERTERRAARRAEESRLSMDLMAANCALALWRSLWRRPRRPRSNIPTSSSAKPPIRWQRYKTTRDSTEQVLSRVLPFAVWPINILNLTANFSGCQLVRTL